MENRISASDRKKLAPLVLGGFLGALAPGFVLADDVGAAPPAFTVSGSATLVNDYIWRGLTQTWGRPALQVGVEADHRSGAYLGMWGSNVSEQWIPGANLELDVYGGFRGAFPGSEDFGFDLGLLYVYYPGGDYAKALDGKTFKGSKVNTAEASVAVSYKWASLKYGRTLTKFYGWNVDNSAPGVFSSVAPDAGVTGSTKGSQFAELNLSEEVADGWTVSGQFGRQWIAHSTGLNWSYYKLGVTKALPDDWSAGLAYSWTTNPKEFESYGSLTGNGETIDAARGRLLLSLARGF